MRSEYVILVCVLFVAGIIAVPETTLKVSKSCKSATENIISWRVNENVTGKDAWVLQMHSHLDCSKCELFADKKMKKWPSSCKSCTDLYWDKIKHWKSCKSCHSVNMYCDTCRKHFTDAMKEYKGKRDALMKKYLDKIHFV